MSSGKRSYLTVLIRSDVRTLFISLKVSKIHSELFRNDYRCWFPKLLSANYLEVGRFNPDCRQVIIKKYLTLATGYDLSK